MQSAGLEADWLIIRGADEFFNVTKTIHNALQGNPIGLDDEQQEIFRRYNEMNAKEFVDDYDFVIVHDAQPAAMIEHFPSSRAKWIWRCHIDLSTPNHQVLDFLLPWIQRYHASIFHRKEYVPGDADLRSAYIWPPAIDPLAPKNMALSPEDAAYIVDQFGIDVSRPLLTQVSRFDPWKDPLGVIDAYRLVKEEHPRRAARARRLDGARRSRRVGVLQPDRRVRGRRPRHLHPLEPQQRRLGRGERVPGALGGRDPEVDPRGLRAHRERGALEGAADGRRATSAASSTRSSTARPVGSCRRSSECADACMVALGNPELARRMALAGKEHVRRHFLTPRLLRDWLALFNQMLGLETRGRRARDRGGGLGIARMAASRRKLIVVSNRGPRATTATSTATRIARRGGGGLVTALRGLLARHDVTWIASAMSAEDFVVADENRGAVVRRDRRATARRSGCGSSRTRSRRTTGSTTSSRTRRSGSSSTTSGT